MLTKSAKPHQAHPNLLPAIVLLLRDPEMRSHAYQNLQNAAMSTSPEKWRRLVNREVMENLCLVVSTPTSDLSSLTAALQIIAALFLRARDEGISQYTATRDWFKEFDGLPKMKGLSTYVNPSIRRLVDFIESLTKV